MTIRQMLYRKKRELRHWLTVCALRVKWRHYLLPTITLDQIVPKPVELAEPILDKICLSPHHSPSDHDDFFPLMSIARYLQPRVIVELGTAFGNLTANLCRQVPSAKVFTVNAPVEDQTGEKVTYQLTRQDIGRVYREHGYAGQVVQIFHNTLTLDLGEYVEDGTVELAIIDACHDREYVLNDFLKIRRFIRPKRHPAPSRHTSKYEGTSAWQLLGLRAVERARI